MIFRLLPKSTKQQCVHLCGSREAAQQMVMRYSLSGACKLHGVNPFAWLKDVLLRIPAHPINRIARELYCLTMRTE